MDTAYVIVIINEYFSALLRKAAYVDCFVKPTVIKKASTTKRKACITLSILKSAVPKVGMFCPGRSTNTAMSKAQTAVYKLYLINTAGRWVGQSK